MMLKEELNKLRKLAGLSQVIEAMKAPAVGEYFGASDSGKPETHTEAELSRVYDILLLAEKINLKQEVWEALPRSLRSEFNYSHWKYTK